MRKLICLVLVSLLPSQVMAEKDQPKAVVTHQIEKNIVQLPDCQDKQLANKANEFIVSYFKENNQGTAKFNRRRYFILHNLDKFEMENIANYKTEKTRPVSDFIIDAKLNHGVIEENMRLCKNKSQNKDASEVYLLIYPENDGFRVSVINLDKKQELTDKTSFFYK